MARKYRHQNGLVKTVQLLKRYIILTSTATDCSKKCSSKSRESDTVTL